MRRGLNSSNKELALKYLRAVLRTKNIGLNAMMFKKEELKGIPTLDSVLKLSRVDLDEIFKTFESAGQDMKEMRQKFNISS